MADEPVYRVVGASDVSFRNREDAVKRAGIWLDAFGSVWLTIVKQRDYTLHFIRDDRGILTVYTDSHGHFVGRTERSPEQDQTNVRRALENWGF